MSQENVERVRTAIEDLIAGKGEFDTDGMLTKAARRGILRPGDRMGCF
jgi:hypothetical protein